METQGNYSGLLPIEPEPVTIPPFDELTMLIFGVPKAGKTLLCSGINNVLFICTEPGAEFVNAPKRECYSWVTFQKYIVGLEQLRENGDIRFSSIVIDIVDNLFDQCRDSVCEAKGLKYPPSNDYGKTWNEVSSEWKHWLRRLMLVSNVKFLSHTRAQPTEVKTSTGLSEEVDRFMPTFSGNKAAQYLDGILNAMGFISIRTDGKHCVTFRGSARVGAGDRTNILASLNEIVLSDDTKTNWNRISKAYEMKANEMGFNIKSKYERNLQ